MIRHVPENEFVMSRNSLQLVKFDTVRLALTQGCYRKYSVPSGKYRQEREKHEKKNIASFTAVLHISAYGVCRSIYRKFNRNGPDLRYRSTDRSCYGFIEIRDQRGGYYCNQYRNRAIPRCSVGQAMVPIDLSLLPPGKYTVIDQYGQAFKQPNSLR